MTPKFMPRTLVSDAKWLWERERLDTATIAEHLNRSYSKWLKGKEITEAQVYNSLSVWKDTFLAPRKAS